MRSFETFTILVYIIDEKIFDVDTSDSDTWHKSPAWKQLVWSLLPQSRSAMLRRVGTYVRLTYNSETPKGDNFYQPNQKQKHFPFNFYLNQENTNRFQLLFFCCYLFIFFDFFKRCFHNIEWGSWKGQGLSTEKIYTARCERGRFVLIFWVKAVQKNVKFIRNLKECKKFHWYHHYQNNCLCYKQFVLF